MESVIVVKKRREAISCVLPILKLLKQRDKTVVAGRYRAKRVYNRSMTLVTKCLPHEVHSILKDYDPVSTVSKKWTTLVLVDDDTFPVFIVSATEENFGSRLLFYTGPVEFKKCLCAEARIQGYKLTSHGLFQKQGVDWKLIAGRTEESIFETLGVRYYKPQVRQYFLTKARRDAKTQRRKSKRQTEAIRTYSGYYVPEAKRLPVRDSARNPLPVARYSKRRPRYQLTMAKLKRANREIYRRMATETEDLRVVLDTWCPPDRQREVRSVRKKKRKRKKRVTDPIKLWRRRRRQKAKLLKENQNVLEGTDNGNTDSP